MNVERSVERADGLKCEKCIAMERGRVKEKTKINVLDRDGSSSSIGVKAVCSLSLSLSVLP